MRFEKRTTKEGTLVATTGATMDSNDKSSIQQISSREGKRTESLSACARAVSPSGNKDYRCSALSARVRGAEKNIERVAALKHAVPKVGGVLFICFLYVSSIFIIFGRISSF